jgi:hypothetical protein
MNRGSLYLSSNTLGGGSGGGSFFGTSTSASSVGELMGFYGVAPFLAVRNRTNLPTVLQASSYVEGAFDPLFFNLQLYSPLQKYVVVANVLPSSPDVTKLGGGWSTVLVYRDDGAFEAFALVWTAATSYQLTPAQTAFQIGTGGEVVTAGDTKLRLTIDGTVSLPQPPYVGPLSLPFAYLSQATLELGSYAAADRSALLQSYILGPAAAAV